VCWCYVKYIGEGTNYDIYDLDLAKELLEVEQIKEMDVYHKLEDNLVKNI
jgi:hypothetical protein